MGSFEAEDDPVKILLSDDEETKTPRCKQQQIEHYQLGSIDSKLVIRQLPSQGLSFQLWPAATTLLSLLDNYRLNPAASPLSSIISPFYSDECSTIRRLNILELGSGTGLVGIAAGITLCANVTVTDLPHVIPNLQFNVEENAGVLKARGGEVGVAELKWGEEGDVEKCGKDFDVVVASDVVYYEELYEPLLKTLRFLMCGHDRKMVFLMAHLRRWKKDSGFFKRARKFFDVDVIHVDPPFQGSRIGVVVYQFVAKCKKFTA